MILPIAYVRDLDETGSYHPCSKDDAGAIGVIPASWYDNPAADCTDLAHPAWWRGHDHTVDSMCSIINDLIKNPERYEGGVSREPWQSTKERLIELAKAFKNPLEF